MTTREQQCYLFLMYEEGGGRAVLKEVLRACGIQTQLWREKTLASGFWEFGAINVQDNPRGLEALALCGVAVHEVAKGKQEIEDERTEFC